MLMSLIMTGCKNAKKEPPVTEKQRNTLNIDSLVDAENPVKAIIAIEDVISAEWETGDSMHGLTAAQKNFHYIQQLEREINNGGFGQYFYNSTGDYAHETLVALQTIGADHTAGMLQKAINEFPEQTVPKERQKRQEILGRIEEKAEPVWIKLDDEFYSPGSDNLETLCIAYIRKNKKDFEK
jgi:Domain of unknown function (DUF4375)